MPGNLDYDAVLKSVLSWPRRDQTALLHAVIDDLASGAVEHPERPEPPEKPAPVAPISSPALYVPIAPISSPAPKKEGGKPWVDETST
ncbi:MAG TPA: hypothetical protein VFC46_17730 [Humisphaera sp.]|nr:hypothetical protein [Humisphaera sp.]